MLRKQHNPSFWFEIQAGDLRSTSQAMPLPPNTNI
jgi:hypothetical protein